MNCPSKNPLQRDGTSQYQRMLEALEPSSAPIHEYSLGQWMQFAYHYAEKINYYNVFSDEVVQGDWSTFMVPPEQIASFLAALNRSDVPADVPPHLALFICFISLLEGRKDKFGELSEANLERLTQSVRYNLNQFTGRHLDFYYTRVLQLQKKAPVEDRVHLIFELAKNIAWYKLEANTAFDAGKDRNNQPLTYVIEDEPVFYPAKVEQLKSVLHLKNHSIRFAEVANSADGLGTPLKEENPTWYAFGFDKVELEKNSGKYVYLPPARLGFALASPVLLLKEGQRTITITLHLNFVTSQVDYSAFATLQTQMVVLLTGEKGWISPHIVTVKRLPTSGQPQLELTVVIDQAEKSIVAYDSEIHKEHYTTNLPVIRLLLETEDSKGYRAYNELSKANIVKAEIHVGVTGMRELVLENDLGPVDAAKPFMPFGAVPKKGSSLYVGNSEIFEKNWQQVKIHWEWMGKPDDLRKHYTAYRSLYLQENFTRNKYDLFDVSGVPKSALGAAEVVTGDNYFKADVSFIKNGKWSAGQEVSLFTTNPVVVGGSAAVGQNLFSVDYGFLSLYKTGFSKDKSYLQQYISNAQIRPAFNSATFNPGFAAQPVKEAGFTAGTKNNFVRISLTTDFFHQHFATLFAAALTNPGAVIPKEPYTPVLSSLVLDYTAKAENDFALQAATPGQKLDNYRKRSIQLFHETPFGQGEQHRFLKEQHIFLTDNISLPLVPRYPANGEFYIGINSAEPETIIPILFQVAEGSENPLTPVIEKENPIRWYALTNNEWKPLNADFVLSDSTNQFLRSGIIRFLIPKESTTTNTIFPGGFTWLKAALPEGICFDAVCRFVDVLAQADVARFVNANNELSHLATALGAGTISKMVNRQSAIKGVRQPFSSFGGRPAEGDGQFYIRVSERLRHKNRAVNIWDYERLVLERFPEVYKVKCLNHTATITGQAAGCSGNMPASIIDELAPGSVRVIPIPDVRNKNLYDLFQPRVSRNTLSEIQEFLQDLTGFHVDCKAENPDYEEVQFDVKVKFYPQYDPKAFARVLNEDLKQLLSPWAFGKTAEISFGGTLYKSSVIAFIEERAYVDFISDFKMYHLRFGANDRDEIVADSSRAILTSSRQHTIHTIQPPVCP